MTAKTVSKKGPAKKTSPVKAVPMTSKKIKHLAGVGLKTPSKLTNKETQELAASVMEHIARNKAK